MKLKDKKKLKEVIDFFKKEKEFFLIIMPTKNKTINFKVNVDLKKYGSVVADLTLAFSNKLRKEIKEK